MVLQATMFMDYQSQTSEWLYFFPFSSEVKTVPHLLVFPEAYLDADMIIVTAALVYRFKMKAPFINFDFTVCALDSALPLYSSPKALLSTGCVTGNVVLSAYFGFDGYGSITADVTDTLEELIQQEKWQFGAEVQLLLSWDQSEQIIPLDVPELIISTSPACPREQALGIQWPKTAWGQVAEQPCPLAAVTSTVTRTCDLQGNWQIFNASICLDARVSLNTSSAVSAVANLLVEAAELLQSPTIAEVQFEIAIEGNV